MKIVNGKKFYAADYGAAKRIDNNGWDRYDGQNWQWYSLFYNPACGLVVLEASNSGCLIRSGDKAEAAALNALLERLEDEQRAEREKNHRRAEQKK